MISNARQLGVLGSVLAVASTPIHAQTETAADETILQEVIVTAQKRETALQKTPMAIAAFAGDSLERERVTNLTDIQSSIPSLVVASNAAIGQPYIRGVGNETLAGLNDAAIATHLNGAYVARGAGLLFDFYDIERVEVLRGPQGTLYGRNATGGVINVITKDAGTSPEGFLNVSASNYDGRRLTAAATLPIDDIFSVRAAVLADRRHGFQRNLADGKDQFDKDVLGGRLTLHARLSQWDFQLVGDYAHDTSAGIATREVSGDPALSIALASGGVTPPRFMDVNVDTPSDQDTLNKGLTLTSRWDGDDTRFTSITAWRTSELDIAIDQDGTQVPVWFGDPEQQQSESFSQELQLSRGGDRYRYMVGAFFFSEDVRDSALLQFGSPFDALLGLSTIGLNSPGSTEAYAVFVNGEYRLTDRFSVTGGLRYSEENKRADVRVSINGAPPPPMPSDRRWDAWTPQVGVNFQVHDDLLLYATVTKGFKSGGVNTFSLTGEAYDPEQLWAYEVGMKADWLDRRLRTNLAVFHYDYTKMQVSQFVTGLTLVENAGAATIDGAELELTARIGTGLELGANIAYLDATYDEFVTSDPLDPAPGPRDLKGNQLPRAPEWSTNFYAQYEHALSGGAALSARVERSYRDNVYYSPLNNPIVAQRAYDLWNASLEYEFPGQQLSAVLWGRNLGDTHYYQFVGLNAPLSGAQGQPAAPRLYGISLEYRF